MRDNARQNSSVLRIWTTLRQVVFGSQMTLGSACRIHTIVPSTVNNTPVCSSVSAARGQAAIGTNSKHPPPLLQPLLTMENQSFCGPAIFVQRSAQMVAPILHSRLPDNAPQASPPGYTSCGSIAPDYERCRIISSLELLTH